VEEPPPTLASAAPAVSADATPDHDCARLRGELKRAVTRICPRWLAAQAEDIVQVALLRVLDAQRRRAGTESLSASYLKRAAYTAMIDEIRRLRRRREVPLEDPAVAERSAAPSSSDPEASRASSEIAAGVASCLLRLTLARRSAVTLYLQGHSVPETGRILGWGAKKAENLVFRGLADLRQCLVSKGYQP
jgi:RNA polymerase sigma-70 factor (ECF subfamily)